MLKKIWGYVIVAGLVVMVILSLIWRFLRGRLSGPDPRDNRGLPDEIATTAEHAATHEEIMDDAAAELKKARGEAAAIPDSGLEAELKRRLKELRETP